MTLRVINGGGQASAAAANGGAGGPVFKKHPLSDALYAALTTTAKDAQNVGQISKAMSTLLNKRVPREHVYSVIRHNRDNISDYGWGVLFVQKGNGQHRMYWVQVGDKAVSKKHKEAFEAATVSFVRGIATGMQHYEDQVSMISDTEGLERSERRKYNKLAGDTAAINTLVQNLLQAVS